MKRTTEGGTTTIWFKEKVSGLRLMTTVEVSRHSTEPSVVITQAGANPGDNEDCIVMTQTQLMRLVAAVKS